MHSIKFLLCYKALLFFFLLQVENICLAVKFNDQCLELLKTNEGETF